MLSNRKQQTVATYTKKGRTLAAWLNSNERNEPSDFWPTRWSSPWFSPSSPIAAMIGFYVATVQDARKIGLAPEEAIRKALFENMIAGMPLPPEEDAALLPGEPDPAKGVYLPMKLRAELRPKGRRVEFKLVGEDENSQLLYMWGELLNSGNETRLRRCANCATFWYCAGRSDRRFCTEACKVSFWQRTPKGKETKKLYMRKWRATVRKLDAKYVENDLTGARLKESRRARKLG